MLRKLLIATTSLALTIPSLAHAQAADPYVGEIITVGFSFCPAGWQEANGAILPISEYDALFSLIGTTYGGDGIETFGVPDLRGRAILNIGQGPGLSINHQLGQQTGATSVTLTTANLPVHTHTAALRAQSAAGDSVSPVRNSIARTATGQNVYSTADPTVSMNAGDVNVQPTGGGQPIEKTSPRLAMLNCVSLYGIFPPRP